MIRNWLRAWLGIQHNFDRVESIDKRLTGVMEMNTETHKIHNELAAALAEVRQLREMVVDPKKIPVQTRNSRQFRALVEQEVE